MTETIEILSPGEFVISPGSWWQPVVREEALRFLEKVHPEAREKTEREAVEILARGIAPGAASAATGLVVGYVQSGKTTSFTAAAALARDNGFAVVVVIAGSSSNLLDQTEKRLADDLRLHDKAAYRRWVHAKSPQPASEEASKIEAALSDWFDPDLENDRPSVLITVMKQHKHLKWLIEVLEDIGSRLDLSRVTALIIDDEADQASPNLKRKEGEESATYGRIRLVRAALPSHTFLEYTATPQATLLLSLIDELSPDYVCVIDPGDAYTGGRYFFEENRGWFIQHIPAGDVAVIDELASGGVGDPPESFKRAFASFALACAAGPMMDEQPLQRSMLVHPSQKTLPQGRFVAWLKAFRDLWGQLLKAPEADLDRKALIEDLLDPAYEDLARSVDGLPDLKDLLRRLPGTLKKLTVEEVNAKKGSPTPIMWSTGYAWALVGGQLLDRGFTVEGLTTTYMPRGLGVGNADTVQQRARFFGYKRDYAGFCRAWLDPEVDAAFTGYVTHEEAMRGELVRIAKQNTPLKEWKRTFLLSKNMKLTRAAVIRLDMSRSTFGKKWFSQTSFDGAAEDIFGPNRQLVDEFCAGRQFRNDEGDSRRDPDTQIHPYVDLPMSDVLEGLLERFVMTDEDSTEFTRLRLLLSVAEDGAEELCRIHRMMGRSTRLRRRSLNHEGKIKNLFQGSNEATGYPGDRSIKSDDLLTVQIHRLELRADDGTEEGDRGDVFATNIPVLAVWVPERFDTSVIVQRL